MLSNLWTWVYYADICFYETVKKEVLNLKQNRDDLSVQDSFIFVSHGRGNNNARGSPKKRRMDSRISVIHSQTMAVPITTSSQGRQEIGQPRPDRSRQADEFGLTVSYKETTKARMSTRPPGGALRYGILAFAQKRELRLSHGLAENLSRFRTKEDVRVGSVWRCFLPGLWRIRSTRCGSFIWTRQGRG